MSEKIVAERRRFIREDNKRFKTNVFVDVPREQWPPFPHTVPLERVMRSREFLVQIFHGEFPRLTICRTEIDKHGHWKEGISWDELMLIKEMVGFGNKDAVEAFPKNKDVVNVANMRHLWIVPEEYSKFFWRDGKGDA